MQLEQFDFDLPPQLIAQNPPERRGQSRLLHLDGLDGQVRDLAFRDLLELFVPGDLLVFNDTRVMRARLFGEKSTGGKVDLLIERIVDSSHALALLHASHPPRPGAVLTVADAIPVRVLERRGEFYLLEFEAQSSVLELLDRFGTVPLPPYIARAATPEDELRYQTVYAESPGAVAAPTAGLHFDHPMLAALRGRRIRLAFLTLHVGAGTFQPVRVADVEQHRMHSEWYRLPDATVAAIARTRDNGGRVTAVGTTTLRCLESAGRDGTLRPGAGETDIFIRPGFKFQVVDRLLTNFHLPRSTLLMLVCAFAGVQNVLRAYRHAVAQGYRFFSYGDAMLIEPSPEAHSRGDATRP
ncbi:MAG TPA: tRNA preQ1(34) S-adenosylmethionine ribosyltransferase-isomerase QueA [Burkholderiales bacterium]|nr:tRNA preQ1(34) S-adenosylmethionine ribosyltransferase-isomerase QueA [Burkholderiales bacterium]